MNDLQIKIGLVNKMHLLYKFINLLMLFIEKLSVKFFVKCSYCLVNTEMLCTDKET